MKQAILSVVLICIALLAFGQGGGKSGAGGSSAASSTPSTTIIYNAKQSKVSPDFAPFPIDKPFSLEIDSIPTNGVRHIFVYPIISQKGIRKIHDKIDKFNQDTSDFRASFELKGQDTAIGANYIALHLPAIRAEMKFDISIVKQFSPSNLARALTLNKVIDSMYYITSVKATTSDKAFAYTRRADSLLKDLVASVSNNTQYHNFNFDYLVARVSGTEQYVNDELVHIKTIEDYKKYFYDPLKMYYKKLVSMPVNVVVVASSKSKKKTAEPASEPLKNDSVILDTTVFLSHSFFGHDQIIAIAKSFKDKDGLPIRNRLYVLQKICDSSKIFMDILTGKRPIDFTLNGVTTDPYDFTARVKNINTAYKLLDSLNNALINLKASGSNTYDKLIGSTQQYLADLKHNSELITRYSAVITKQTLLNSTENIWVIGQSTKSPDLTTLSSRLLAINAGVTNIFAYNNSGKVAAIPKFFLGIDVHLKAFDKNADFSDIPSVASSDSQFSHILEARPSIFFRWSLTLGVTFGPMPTKDFNNTYGTFSFTFGPSYAINKYIKISSGVAFIHRYDNNPLLSSTDRLILGPYVSLSLDYDLLNIVQGVTSSLFK